jgi:hypothetical protein
VTGAWGSCPAHEWQYVEEPGGDLPVCGGRTLALQCCYFTALCAYPFILAYLTGYLQIYQDLRSISGCGWQSGTTTSFKDSWPGSVVSRRPLPAVSWGSIPDEFMWDLWWTKWHWDTFLPIYLRFSTALAFYQCPITMLCLWNVYSLRIWQFCWRKHFAFSHQLILISFVFSIRPSIFLFCTSS